MIPDDVKQKWADKLKVLALIRGNLALPYPSTLMLALSGQAAGSRELTASLQALMEISPEELPLDGGTARCKAIDSTFYDTYVKRHGTRPRGISVMEAVWLGTDEALYYIAPNVSQYRRWEWSAVQLRQTKHGRRFSRVVVDAPDGTLKFGLGSLAAANLMTLFAWGTEPPLVA